MSASSATPSAAARQSALLLHGLAGIDRAWVLSKLDVARRAELEPLLEELAGLGLPPSLDLLEAVLSGADSRAVPGREDVPARGSSPSTARTGALPGWLIARLVAHEPDEVALRILRLADRAARKGALRRLDVLRRRELEKHVGEAPEPGRGACLDRAISAAVLERAGDIEGDAPSRWREARQAIGRRVSEWRGISASAEHSSFDQERR